MPNRQVRYENQTIHIDQFGDGQRHTSEFDFNFANAGFSRFGDEDIDATGGGGGGGGGGHHLSNNHKIMNNNSMNNYTRTTTAGTSASVSAHTSTTYYPDFTGSREMGIDVGGPMSMSPSGGGDIMIMGSATSGNPNRSNLFDRPNSSANIPPELPPLPTVPKYPVLLKSNGDISKLVVNDTRTQTNNNKSSIMASDSDEEKEAGNNEDSDDINFSYFDIYKKGIVVSDEATKTTKPLIPANEAAASASIAAILTSVANKTTYQLPKSEDEKEEEEAENQSPHIEDEDDDEDVSAAAEAAAAKALREEAESQADEESESNNIFSKDIEESLPELFGSYKSSVVNLNSMATTTNTDSVVSSHKMMFAPNSVVSKTGAGGKTSELDVVRSRGTLGGGPSSKNSIIHRIPETETENEEYVEDAEDEHEDDEDESSSTYSLQNKPKQALKVTSGSSGGGVGGVNVGINNMLDSSATTDVGGDDQMNGSRSSPSSSSSASSPSSASSSDEYDYKTGDGNPDVGSPGGKTKKPPKTNLIIKAAKPVGPRINEEILASVNESGGVDDDPFSSMSSPNSNNNNYNNNTTGTTINVLNNNNYFANGNNLKSESDYFFLNGIGRFLKIKSRMMVKLPNFAMNEGF